MIAEAFEPLPGGKLLVLDVSGQTLGKCGAFHLACSSIQAQFDDSASLARKPKGKINHRATI
jgi:hypothetical protein